MNLKTTFYEWARNERLIHSIKTALACLIGFIVASYIHFQAAQWIAITTIVVMCAQINVGSVIQKSYMRFLGTLAGSLFAILTLKLFGNDLLVNINVALIATLFFSFIATSTKSYNESGTLGAVTVIIILFGQNPTVQTGIERFSEISLGILIAALISQFIFPIHAKTLLQRNQATTLKKIRVFYLNLFLNHPSPNNSNILGNLDEEIVKSLIMQRKLAGEARKEKMGKRFNINYFHQSLWCEKEIIRSIIFMFYAYQQSADLIIGDNLLLLEKFHQEIADTLENISSSIEQNKIPADVFISNLTPLKSEERISVNAFIFCAEILVERLHKIVSLLKEASLLKKSNK